MIVETVSNSDFHEAFRRMGRIDQFSREARDLLFEYLEQYSEDSGKPVELDVIALCCEYYESDAEEVAANYSQAPQLADFDGDEEAHADAIEEWLCKQTFFIGRTSGGFVYAAF